MVDRRGGETTLTVVVITLVRIVRDLQLLTEYKSECHVGRGRGWFPEEDTEEVQSPFTTPDYSEMSYKKVTGYLTYYFIGEFMNNGRNQTRQSTPRLQETETYFGVTVLPHHLSKTWIEVPTGRDTRHRLTVSSGSPTRPSCLFSGVLLLISLRQGTACRHTTTLTTVLRLVCQGRPAVCRPEFWFVVSISLVTFILIPIKVTDDTRRSVDANLPIVHSG